MKAMRVLLLVSAILLGGWSESYAETMSVMNWHYYPQFKKNDTYLYEYEFFYDGFLNSGHYTLGIIYITNDRNNDYAFGILNESISYNTANAHIDPESYEYKGKLVDLIYFATYDLTEPLFANAYKNKNFVNYLSFGAYWSYQHDGTNLTLSIPVLFGWNISIFDPPFDYYAVFYIKQDSDGKIVYSQGLQVGNPPAVPLPGTALLLGSGLAGLALMSRRLRRR